MRICWKQTKSLLGFRLVDQVPLGTYVVTKAAAYIPNMETHAARQVANLCFSPEDIPATVMASICVLLFRPLQNPNMSAI